MAAQRLGLGFLHAERLDHQNAAVLGLGGERMLERERAHLLRQANGVTAGVRAEGAAAAAEQIDARGAMARRAGAFLPVHFLAGARDLRPVFDLVGAALTLRQLPHHAAMNDVGARLESENGVRQRDRASLLAVERGDLNFHITRPSSASWLRPACFRSSCFRPWPWPRLWLRLWPALFWLRSLLAWPRLLRRASLQISGRPAGAQPRRARPAAQLAGLAAQLAA